MSNSNKITSRANNIIFVDYTPAELRKNKDWLIVYYFKNPLTNKMERQRDRVPPMANTRQRERYALKVVAAINKKLEEGYSPFLETAAKQFKTFKECQEKFMEFIESDIKKGEKSEDTRRAYASYLSLINTYIAEKEIKITFAFEINKAFAVNYLDWVYYERNNSTTTFNNHLTFIGNFGNFLIDRGYIRENPANGIRRKKKAANKVVVIKSDLKTILREKLPIYNKFFFCLCMAPYYCMIRRTELTKLKVSDFDLDLNTIKISRLASKVNEDDSITIPEEYKELLARHLDGANGNDFAFSTNDFKPGAVQLKPKKISDTFAMLRKKWELPSSLQWYDLKRTGITDLFENREISSLKIRDQARHKSLKTTELYAPKGKGGDSAIIKSGAKF